MMPSAALFLAIGLVAGLLSGVFGIGGGVVIVPALIYLAGFTPLLAARVRVFVVTLGVYLVLGAFRRLGWI